MARESSPVWRIPRALRRSRHGSRPDRDAYLRVRNDALAAESAEVSQSLPATGLVLFEERGHPREEGLDHIRADGVVEHRGRAHLRGSAAEQEVTERMIERRDPADS